MRRGRLKSFCASFSSKTKGQLERRNFFVYNKQGELIESVSGNYSGWNLSSQRFGVPTEDVFVYQGAEKKLAPLEGYVLPEFTEEYSIAVVILLDRDSIFEDVVWITESDSEEGNFCSGTAKVMIGTKNSQDHFNKYDLENLSSGMIIPFESYTDKSKGYLFIEDKLEEVGGYKCEFFLYRKHPLKNEEIIFFHNEEDNIISSLKGEVSLPKERD